MRVGDESWQSVWVNDSDGSIGIIDQTWLPQQLRVATLASVADVCEAISTMRVRGAPLIGVVGALGMALGAREHPEREAAIAEQLIATRPTAINLRWAVARVRRAIAGAAAGERAAVAFAEARAVMREDIAVCSRIGDHGLGLLASLWRAKADPAGRLNILTHCNAGWLATVDWGTALAPIFKAHQAGVPVHVWVDETRPRSQGTLTAWELANQGVPHTLICDNTGGHLMQRGMVDACLVGTDRTTARGDVCNKIGTYLKALAAADNNLPFYVALPSSTVDWDVIDGATIPIEQRSQDEVLYVQGACSGDFGNEAGGQRTAVRISGPGTGAANYAFDVTPARLVSALITEYGVIDADAAGLTRLQQWMERNDGSDV